MNTQPNWLIAAAIGAVIGILLEQIPTAYRAIRDFRRKGPLSGTWFHYHFSRRSGQLQLRTYQWRIDRGYKHPLNVRVTALESASGGYRGVIDFEKGFLLVKVGAEQHNETVFFRFRNTAPTKKQKMLGFCLAEDYDGNASMSVDVLSREQLTEQQIREYIKHQTTLNPSTRAVTLE